MQNTSHRLEGIARTIEEEARAASQWCQEMLDDFGVNELTWTKSKAEEDLESLNKAYKTLDEFNTGDDSISEATKRCRDALEEAIQKLNELVEDLNLSIDYEQKLKFLSDWLEKVENQVSNEPFNVTVKDQLEKNIEKYEKLNEVITQKEVLVSEVIQHGEELADRAKTKQESYRAGVSSLDAEWKRVTKMVDERKHKLSEWSVSLHKYEEVYVGTVRSCEDLSHEVSKLEESVLEEVEFAEIMSSIEILKEQIENVKAEAEAIIEDFEKTDNGTDKGQFLELVNSVPENLKADCKDLDKRLQQIKTNQELSIKLAEKGKTVIDFVEKANAVLDSDRLPVNPNELEEQLDMYDRLDAELEDLEVVVKMISDWSVEIQKGPNPSKNVDDMESLLSDQMSKTKRSIENKAHIFKNLVDNWKELEDAFALVEERSNRIKSALEESDADTVKLAELIDEADINKELNSIQEMINVFLDGNIMSEYLEEKGQGISSNINSQIAEAQRKIRASTEDEKSEEIEQWVESSSQMVHKAESLGELQTIHEKIQQFANDIDQNNSVQEKLIALDDLVRDRVKSLSETKDVDEQTQKVKTDLQTHISLLEKMESSGETAVDKPAEFQIALNAIDSLEEKYKDLPEFTSLKEKIEVLRLPEGTNDRTSSVEAKLSDSEAQLATTEVKAVSLSGTTIEEAKAAVTQVYTDLVTVKNDLEQLISTKRKLNEHGFIDKDTDFSLSLVALRERFNNIGKRITDSKVALSKSARRVQKLKRAVEDTDQWAHEVLAQSVEQYPMTDRLRMASDAEIRKREVLEATEDCVNKLQANLGADCSQLVADVHQGLDSTETLVKALRNEEIQSDASSTPTRSTPSRAKTAGQKISVTKRPELSPIFSNKENVPIPKERHSVKEIGESKDDIKGINIMLSKIEIELEDSTLGVSNPKYITRQAEILSVQREKLDEVKAYLETENDEDNPNLRTIASTKYKALEETYAEKKNAFDAVAEIWSGFEKECNTLLEDLRPENISHDVVVDAADRLKALKFKVNSAKEPATSPRKGDSKAQEMLEKAQNLIDNFEDQKIMKIEQTDEQKSEEVTRTYESVQQFAKSSVMVYGCQASINTVEQQIESFEKCLLDESASEEDEEKMQKIHSLIQKKKTDVQIVKETSKTIKEVQSQLVVELETAHQTFITLENRSTNTTEESHDLLEQYEKLNSSMFEIESKQSQIRHEVNEANDTYGFNFEIKEDILCESVVMKLRQDLSDAQRVTVEKWRRSV
ncbi:Oidioi.mRNA.OKI2018_I69.PAR.g10860.t3.cds [Oikopleura dioica]|uniref:Oidioi.mRNA.OKI2018_I69.PAR.g10860.t3.cds n=1 Tax=Oikopleura dioica TaxID=34765 RepID=A0ABN7RX81_OIKDI|nr:Oidioi.mRNA.OKI2018_I69.PAR.g10860.t3.cds [Oikopleura dioica]